MKRKMIYLTLVSLFTLGVLATSCTHHHPHFRRSTENLLKRIDGRVKKLDLTDMQQVQYEQIRTRLQKDLETDMADLREFRERMSEELAGPDPDLETVAEMLKENVPVIRNRYIDYFVEFYNILDEKQKEKIVTRMNRRFKRAGHRTF
jgi:Spy/CpxP family protein refolding chaperone